MLKVAVACGLAVTALGALLIGPGVFNVLVLLLAGVVLIDMSILLAAGGARPVLPVALIPGLVLPSMVVADIAADPSAGWDRIPSAFALAVLAAFTLVLVFGRRGGAVVGLSATAMVALVVGLGATALLLLRGLPDGFRWVLALGLMVGAADAAGSLVAAARQRALSRGEPAFAVDGDGVMTPLDGVAPALLAVTVVGGILLAVMGETLTPLVVVLLAVVAVVCALGGAFLQGALALEAGVDADQPEARLGQGVLFGAVDALMLAAPAAYVVARSVAL